MRTTLKPLANPRLDPRDVARRLHARAVAASRDPKYYAELGVADTVDGRFELLTLQVVLIVARLAGEGPEAERARQALFDLYLRNLDGALREMGVGDLAVPKRMKSIGQLFYGRAKAYDDAFTALPDSGPLETLVNRTLLIASPRTDPAPLAAAVVADRERPAVPPIQDLLEEGFA